jgi:hypothetical protein
MLTVVYMPLVAHAIERYSAEFRRPDGVYLSVDDVDRVETALRNYGLEAGAVDLIVVTDGEAQLGICDWAGAGRTQCGGRPTRHLSSSSERSRTDRPEHGGAATGAPQRVRPGVAAVRYRLAMGAGR